MTDLEKKLIAMNAHGIWIDHVDGHRWIRNDETYTMFDFDDALSEAGVSLNNKIYGGVVEAINVVDEAVKLSLGYTLIEYFDSRFDIDWEIMNCEKNHNRIDVVSKNKGGIY